MTEKEYLTVRLLRELQVAQRELVEARIDASAIQHDSEGTIISTIVRLDQLAANIRASLMLDADGKLKIERKP